MWAKVFNFIKYNNAFSIGFMFVFFGFGVTFAASPTLQESVYASQSSVKSVDNRRIVSAKLDAFDFGLRINSVTEDKDNYYISYSYKTITLDEGVWHDVSKTNTIMVNKKEIEGKDLGLYVAGQLSDNINYELDYLKRVQLLETKKGETQKIVTTEYRGLVGKFLDPKDEVIKGYVPVVDEEVEEEIVQKDPLPTNVRPGQEETEKPESKEDKNPLSEAEIRSIVEQYLRAQGQEAEEEESTEEETENENEEENNGGGGGSEETPPVETGDEETPTEEEPPVETPAPESPGENTSTPPAENSGSSTGESGGGNSSAPASSESSTPAQ